MTLPSTMQALTMTGFGGLDQLRVGPVTSPTISHPDQVLIRVHAAALNRIDLFVLQGLPKASYAWPHVMGADAAGVIEAVGPAVTRVQPGDRVVVNPGISCGHCDSCLGGEQPLCRGYRILGEHLEGSMAEWLVVPEANVALISDRLRWAEAAALPMAGLTAWRMLVTRAQVRPGETVLIWGIGGGVSLIALQIAKRAGARVVVTSSSEDKLNLARELGADLCLNHRTGDVVRAVRELTGVGADVVVDSVGEKTWVESLRALRPMGRIVTCGATTGPHVQLDLRKLFWFQWTVLGSTMGNHREFQEVVRLADRGELRPVVDSVVSLADAPAAFARLAAGQQLGKLVIEVTP